MKFKWTRLVTGADSDAEIGIFTKSSIEVMTVEEMRRGIVLLATLGFIFGALTATCLILNLYTTEFLCKYL